MDDIRKKAIENFKDHVKKDVLEEYYFKHFHKTRGFVPGDNTGPKISFDEDQIALIDITIKLAIKHYLNR